MDELDEACIEKLFFVCRFPISPAGDVSLTFTQWFWLSIIFYNIGLGLTKISIIMQYLRIFATTQAMRYATLGTLAFTVLYALEAILLSVFSCTPVNFFWIRTSAGHCVNFKALWFSHAALNIFSDVLIISLPMPVIKGLNIPTKQKFALMAIFALGAFGCVTSILRLKALHQVADSTDQSYDNVGAAVWSNVEINVAIMCASLPTFKALIKRLFPHLLSTDQASRSVANKYGTSGGWKSRNARQHGTLISLDGLERGDRRRQEGHCTTTIEKGTTSFVGSDAGSSQQDDGIKVTTVVSQREDSSSDKQALYPDDVHSISESERKFFPHS
ncbi:hypothetical protein MPH_01707 [Macrophomina phaseolina MS6]|uniref:Rhodopsin domain-containing protein n=1 Tax=Macrophomina phaseolina (strain MS6) TaxID=1126212 RepID=K2S7V2_MACPH|nr:hypothetical protein MPH_01707 [Macrophomina phaseolina MS6]